MNERGDVKGYLRVAVQAVLGREEETVNLPLRPISIFSLGGLPTGCPSVCQDCLPGLVRWPDGKARRGR